MGALTEPKKVGDLLRAIAEYQGQPITRAALQLAALLFQRPGNVRAMEWAELDLEAAMWSIPAAKMKRRLDGKRNGRPHLVPLSTQAVAIFKDDLHPLTGADSASLVTT
jgi:integrase